MAEGNQGGPRKIEVPEPGRRHSPTAEASGDEADLSARAIPLDVGGPVAGWLRRHKIEISLFAITILLLSVGAFLIMRDAGPSHARDVISVGPSPGQQLDPYIAVRKRALEDAASKPGQRVAVVTLDKRMTPGDFENLGISPPLTIDGVILGVNGHELEVVQPGSSFPDTANAWISKQEDRYEAQLTGTQDQLAASPSPTAVADWFSSQKKAAQQGLDRLAAGTVVEGAIVSGQVKDLESLGQKAGVLLVDLAPEGKRTDEIIPILAGGAGS